MYDMKLSSPHFVSLLPVKSEHFSTLMRSVYMCAVHWKVSDASKSGYISVRHVTSHNLPSLHSPPSPSSVTSFMCVVCD